MKSSVKGEILGDFDENEQHLLSRIDGARPERDDGPEPPQSVEQAGVRQGRPTIPENYEQEIG